MGIRRLLQWTAGAGAASALTLLLVTVPAFAANYSSGTYGSCVYNSGCSISITVSSSNNVALDITPTAGSTRCTVQKDVVTVGTGNSAGYTLSLLASNAALTKTGAPTTQINPVSGTQASPVLPSSKNWGYRVDGVGGFGAGPTTAHSNTSPSGVGGLAKVPASPATGDTIANTNTAATPPVDTNVWYGVCADATVPSGQYTGSVQYTAVAN